MPYSVPISIYLSTELRARTDPMSFSMFCSILYMLNGKLNKARQCFKVICCFDRTHCSENTMKKKPNIFLLFISCSACVLWIITFCISIITCLLRKNTLSFTFCWHELLNVLNRTKKQQQMRNTPSQKILLKSFRILRKLIDNTILPNVIVTVFLYHYFVICL